MDRKPYEITVEEFLLINLPVILFLFLVPAGVLAYRFLQGIWRWSAVPLVIWGFSGAILLYRDFLIRKREIYIRLLRYNGDKMSPRRTNYLRTTLCGLAMEWALRARLKKINRRKSQ